MAHRFSLTDATENMMLFEQVRIPLYRENGMARDTRSFANDLRKYLNQKANLTCKVMTKGFSVEERKAKHQMERKYCEGMERTIPSTD